MSAYLFADVFRMHHSTVTPLERLLLLYLADSADEDNIFNLDLRRTNERTSMNVDEIKATLKTLERKRLIRKCKEDYKPIYGEKSGEYYEIII